VISQLESPKRPSREARRTIPALSCENRHKRTVSDLLAPIYESNHESEQMQRTSADEVEAAAIIAQQDRASHSNTKG